MKQKSTKRWTIISVTISLLLIFLLGISSTYAYITFSEGDSYETAMGNFVVNMIYSTGSTVVVEPNTTAILYPCVSNITRGEPFGISNVAVSESNPNPTPSTVGFRTVTNSIPAYIRFWIDAYAVVEGVEDKSNNYGMWFELYFAVQSTDGDWVYNYIFDDANPRLAQSTINGNKIYYRIEALSAGNYSPFNALKVADNAPADVVGKNLVLYFSFDAVQATNGAFRSVFNDGRGYYAGWN